MTTILPVWCRRWMPRKHSEFTWSCCCICALKMLMRRRANRFYWRPWPGGMMWMKLRWSGYFANSISSNWMRNDRCFVLLTWIGWWKAWKRSGKWTSKTVKKEGVRKRWQKVLKRPSVKGENPLKTRRGEKRKVKKRRVKEVFLL